MAKKILITIDVEDWFQVENLRPWFPPNKWHSQESRVEWNTSRLLALFESFEYSVKTTFFVLGRIADRYPDLVRRIQARGHEISSHGYSHLLNYEMGERALIGDLKKSKRILEDITGVRVKGYRAPSFSISDPILKRIQKVGYTYDSSYNSFQRHGRYGTISMNGKAPNGNALKIADGFYELPISNIQLWGQTIPWGGGGYFRIIPYMFFKAGVRLILMRKNAYLIYLHPWEFDPFQPRPKKIGGVSKLKHYLNLEKTFDRLKKFITDFEGCHFCTCSQYLSEIAGDQAVPSANAS